MQSCFSFRNAQSPDLLQQPTAADVNNTAAALNTAQPEYLAPIRAADQVSLC